MGTLFSQPERRNYNSQADLEEFLENAGRLSAAYKISITDVIQASRTLELKRQNDLYVANGDIKDEQLAGLGEILNRMAGCFDEIAGQLLLISKK